MSPCDCIASRLVRDPLPTDGNVIVQCTDCRARWVGTVADGALTVAPPDAVAIGVA